ncbi:MAG: hypothetical protein ACYDA2_06445 [Acidimicrobiales bacterium]
MPSPSVPPEPPQDPEAWSDEQWLDWLRATDADDEAADADAERVTARWMERPGPSALGAAMIGLRNALYGEPEEKAVYVAEAPGGPPDDDAPVVHLDPEHPERSEVVVRRRRRRGDAGTRG